MCKSISKQYLHNVWVHKLYHSGALANVNNLVSAVTSRTHDGGKKDGDTAPLLQESQRDNLVSQTLLYGRLYKIMSCFLFPP